MIILLFCLLIFVILFAREIRFIIAIVFLCGIMLTLWGYWWGKIISVALILFIFIGIFGLAIEKYQNSPFGKSRKSKKRPTPSIDDESTRERAYHYALEHWYKQDDDTAASQINSYREWNKDFSSNPVMEEWYQENKETFQ